VYVSVREPPWISLLTLTYQKLGSLSEAEQSILSACIPPHRTGDQEVLPPSLRDCSTSPRRRGRRRWYLRSPDDVEGRRRAVADARYQAFFAPEHLAEPLPALRPAGEPSQGARGGSINSDSEFRENDPEWARTRRAGGPNRWLRDETSGANRGARPVPLPSPALGRKDEGSQPFPLSPISLPAGRSRPAPLSPIFASHPSSSAGFSTAASPARSMSYHPEQPATPKEVSRQASSTRAPRHRIWIAGRQPGELDLPGRRSFSGT